MAWIEIACCGLNCAECKIFQASIDAALAERISEEFKKNRNLDIKPEVIRCSGCHGDRSLHWSSDCEILHCAMDERGLESCSQCPDFPCLRIESWAEGSLRYREALERLKGS